MKNFLDFLNRFIILRKKRRKYEKRKRPSNTKKIKALEAEISRLKKEITKLTNQLKIYLKEIDLSFIPNSWTKVKQEDVVTNKTQQDGIALQLDIRDLFNSTVYSRTWAEQVISEVGPMRSRESLDSYFNRLALSAANLVVLNIYYETNQSQFKVADRWNNGDTAIVTKKGDCDLSVRVFVRVLNDVLDELKMYGYKKYVFQCIGIFAKVGHSWGMVYNPVDKKFKLIECTRDERYNSLPTMPSNYDMWFCLNFKNIWYLNQNWRQFL